MKKGITAENKKDLQFKSFINFLKQINFISNSDLEANTNEEENIIINKKNNLLEFCTVQIEDCDTTVLGKNLLSSENIEKNEDTLNLSQELNQLFGVTIDMSTLYGYYLEINSNANANKHFYSFSEFSNLFKILNYVLLNFNKEILKINLDSIFEENISMYFIKKDEETNPEIINKYKDAIGNLFNKKNENESDPKCKNLLFLFHIFTMCGQLNFTLPMSNLKLNNFLTNLSIYNNFFISHFNYFLLVHFSMIIFYHFSIREENKQTNLNNLFKSNGKKKSITIKNENKESLVTPSVIPTVYLIDNILNKDLEDEMVRNCICINQCKYYLLNYFSGPHEIPLIINLITCHTDLFKNTIFYYEFNSNDCSKIMTIDKSTLLSLEDLQFSDRKLIHFNEISLSVKKGSAHYELVNLFKKYEQLIVKSENFIIKDNISEQSEFVPFESFYAEMEIIDYLINYCHKIFKLKKKRKEIFNFFIQINFFNMKMKTQPDRMIKLAVNYSNLKESELLSNLSLISCFSKVYLNFKQIIKSLLKFKKTIINVVLLKNTFESEELFFIMNTLLISIQNYIEEKGIKNLNIDKLVSSKHTIMINNIYREKDKKSILSKRLKKLQNPTLGILNKFADQILTYFNQVIINDYTGMDNNKNFIFNPSSLIRNFKENKIIIKNFSVNSYSVDIYIQDKLFFDKIMDLVKTFKSDSNLLDLISEVTVIIHKTFFEDVINKDFANSPATSNFYNLVDKFYIIESGSELDYDIYVLEKRLCIISHKPISDSINNKFTKEYLKDSNTKKVFVELFKILHDCIKHTSNNKMNDEFASLNILLGTREKFFTKFSYIYQTYPTSNLSMITLVNGSFYVSKLANKTKRTFQIFNNHDLIKNSNACIKFSINHIPESQEFDINNYSSITKNIIMAILKFVLDNFEIDKISSSDEAVTNENIEIIINSFNKLLGEKVFSNQINNNSNATNKCSYLPIAYYPKYFFKFLKIFYNFYQLNRGKIFDNVLLIPFDYSPDNVDNIKKELKFYFSKDSFNYFVARNIFIYETEFRRAVDTDMNWTKLDERVLKGIPFHSPQILTTLKLMETTYQKINYDTNKELDLCFDVNENFNENNKEEDKQNVNEKINFQVSYSKSNLLEAVITEIFKEKQLKMNNNQSDHMNVNLNYGNENYNYDNSAKSESDSKKKHKKCLIY